MVTPVLPDLPTTEDHLDFEGSAVTLASVIKEQELWRALLMRVLEAVRAVAEGRPTSEHEE
jgi:hypothetical protein